MKIFTLQVLFLNYYSYLCTRNSKFLSPDGGIGRRVGLKHQWGNTRAGSTPALGTGLNRQSFVFSIGWRFCFAIFGDFYPFIGSLMTFGSCNRVELIELSPRSRLYLDLLDGDIYHAWLQYCGKSKFH